MGSFASMCTLSGLPIECGDPVRFGLLCANPYAEGPLNVNHVWFPRCWPVKGQYNDAGSVECVEGAAVRQAILEGFKIDLVELGWGDNTYHDLAAHKDWSFDGMLAAVRSGRVMVRRDLETAETAIAHAYPSDYRHFTPRGKVPKGVPTRRRVEAVLRAGGMSLFTGTHRSDTLVVRRQARGRVGVQMASYSNLKRQVRKLKEAAALLSRRYATVLAHGSGNTPPPAELVVLPKPGTPNYHPYRPRDKPGPMRVGQYFIREDVWRGVLSMELFDTSWSEGEVVDTMQTVTPYREAAQLVWNWCVEDCEDAWFKKMDLENGGPTPTSLFLKDAVPHGLGLGTSFELVAREFKRGKMTPEEAGAFLDSAAEFAFVQDAMALARYYWRPSYAVGPQYGVWDAHEKFHAVMREIAIKARKERDGDE